MSKPVNMESHKKSGNLQINLGIWKHWSYFVSYRIWYIIIMKFAMAERTYLILHYIQNLHGYGQIKMYRMNGFVDFSKYKKILYNMMSSQ